MRRWLGSECNDDDNMMMINLVIILEYSFLYEDVVSETVMVLPVNRIMITVTQGLVSNVSVCDENTIRGPWP